MPHECTTCGRTFPDGSKEMLSGCPECGGNKFKFRPSGQGSGPGPTSAGSTSAGTTTDDPTSVGSTTGESTSTEPTSTGTGPDAGGADADAASGTDETAVDETTVDAAGDEPIAEESVADDTSPNSADDPSPKEDGAQASARSEMVTPDELPANPNRPTTAEEAADVDDPEPEIEDPDLEALRAKLNDQFESIRILNPGQYELNLMELYDREEYIISLREDGRYVIEMPEAWGPVDDEDE